MALTCNIDAKGKLARLIYGIILTAIGVAIAIFIGWRLDSILGWIIAGACLLGGGFAVFEAWAGWCVMRAMGFKTPM